jgi:hypothetical protein
MQRRPLLQRESTKGQAYIPSHEQAVEVESWSISRKISHIDPFYPYPISQHILSEANYSKVGTKGHRLLT